MTRREQSLYLLLAISPLLYCPFAHWIAMRPHGTSLFLFFELELGILVLFAVIAVPVCLILILLDRNRSRARIGLFLSVIFIPSFALGAILGENVRMSCIKSFAEHSEPLIEAVKSFERDHQRPPQTLTDLVPKYLQSTPTTGMGGYPKYEYHTGSESRDLYDSNPWALTVSTPNVGINFDMVLYLPLQNYPESGYGGWLQRIGDWAYVHE